MKIIIGLGNPGKEYGETRHNAGFLFLDMLKDSWGFPEFVPEKKFAGLVSAGMKDDKKTLLVKPVTFMNHSGEAVVALANFFKLTPADITVVHDDLDLPFGTWKIAAGSGAAGHNGVTDIIERLGTKEFRRIRIGIGRPEGDRDPADYVLSRFTPEEERKLPEILTEILAKI
ncbi:MAG: aminoacyl-tRNA hydrolase [Candidatus Moranbacteria bacterium]|nr:aminoacyl-tRNA hydrolase [Candidatus Moranbacteria bacterium]